MESLTRHISSFNMGLVCLSDSGSDLVNFKMSLFRFLQMSVEKSSWFLASVENHTGCLWIRGYWRSRPRSWQRCAARYRSAVEPLCASIGTTGTWHLSWVRRTGLRFYWYNQASPKRGRWSAVSTVITIFVAWRSSLTTGLSDSSRPRSPSSVVVSASDWRSAQCSWSIIELRGLDRKCRM